MKLGAWWTHLCLPIPFHLDYGCLALRFNQTVNSSLPLPMIWRHFSPWIKYKDAIFQFGREQIPWSKQILIWVILPIQGHLQESLRRSLKSSTITLSSLKRLITPSLIPKFHCEFHTYLVLPVYIILKPISRFMAQCWWICWLYLKNCSWKAGELEKLSWLNPWAYIFTRMWTAKFCFEPCHC